MTGSEKATHQKLDAFADVISDTIHKDACMELYTGYKICLTKFTRLALCHFTKLQRLAIDDPQIGTKCMA